MTALLQRPRVALFGGSFDPPHCAHQQISAFLLENHHADQVWYVPVKHHPFGKTVSSDTDRVAMLELVLANLRKEHPHISEKLKIENWELEQDQTSYTFKTLESLSKKYPQFEFVWVVGTDNLPKFDQWKNYQEILEKFGVLVYPRAGYPPKPLRKGMEYFAKAPEVTVSSTQLRQQVAKHQPLGKEILPEVEQYVMDHQLYDRL